VSLRKARRMILGRSLEIFERIAHQMKPENRARAPNTFRSDKTPTDSTIKLSQKWSIQTAKGHRAQRFVR